MGDLESRQMLQLIAEQDLGMSLSANPSRFRMSALPPKPHGKR
jgi:hypothetical protein